MTQIEYSKTSVSFTELAKDLDQIAMTSFTLKDVTITGDDMDEFGCSKALRAHATLEEVSLTNVTVVDAAASLNSFISMLLVTCPKIRVLLLDNTRVSTPRSVAAAAYCTTLEELLLRNNGLEDADAAQIAEAVAQNGNIQSLDLTGNSMTDVGCAAFAKALQKNISLSVLKLDGNIGISGGSLSEITATMSKRGGTSATAA
jgi:Ran GTPase-activating protein (RanGAP) involved in mRNA processing and transport